MPGQIRTYSWSLPNGSACRSRPVVVADTISDMLVATRCQAFGVGVLSGGYGSDELRQAGAMRVYDDPADVLRHIDAVGGRRSVPVRSSDVECRFAPPAQSAARPTMIAPAMHTVP